MSGVSISTVSRVLSGDTAVKADRVTRVLDAVDLLGYQRNDVASTLRRADRGSASIGLILEDVANPFFSAVHRGVEDIARPHGVVTLAGSSDEDPEQERRLAAAFTARRVDGLIVVPAGDDHAYLLRERAAGMPLVFLDRPPRLLESDTVLTDNAGGARLAVEHLLATGHRRIAFLGGREPIHTAIERRSGYLEALRDHAIAVPSELVCTDLHDAAAARAGSTDAAARTGPAERDLQRPEPAHDRRTSRASRARRTAHRRARRLRRHPTQRRGRPRPDSGRPGPIRAERSAGIRRDVLPAFCNGYDATYYYLNLKTTRRRASSTARRRSSATCYDTCAASTSSCGA